MPRHVRLAQKEVLSALDGALSAQPPVCLMAERYRLRESHQGRSPALSVAVFAVPPEEESGFEQLVCFAERRRLQ